MDIKQLITNKELELKQLEKELKGFKEEQTEEIYETFNKINYLKGFIDGLKTTSN